MTTILPIGTARCIACHTPVAIVRRTVELACRCEAFGYPDYLPVLDACGHPHHAIPDAAWTVVEADGTRHLCPVAA